MRQSKGSKKSNRNRREFKCCHECGKFGLGVRSGEASVFEARSLCICGNIHARKRGIAKKLILTIRAITIGQQIDLVPDDFNGTAWRCRNRDNISIVDEACCRLHCQRRRALHHCGDRDRFQTTGLTPVDSFSHRVLIGIGKCACTAPFPFTRKALGLRPTDQNCHHETWLHLDFVDWRSTRSHHDEHDRRLFLFERPTACSFGHQKRRISEVMNDLSLSS